MTADEIYKRNQKKSKIFKILAPICFWGFIALGIVFLIIAIKNSFGNIAEILDLLDNKKYTGEELNQNYDFLIAKYGEWTIGSGGSGFQITFVNIGKAVFSGVMIASLVFSILFFVASVVVGKWLFPKLSKQIIEDNQDMVNLKILKQN